MYELAVPGKLLDPVVSCVRDVQVVVAVEREAAGLVHFPVVTAENPPLTDEAAIVVEEVYAVRVLVRDVHDVGPVDRDGRGPDHLPIPGPGELYSPKYSSSSPHIVTLTFPSVRLTT